MFPTKRYKCTHIRDTGSDHIDAGLCNNPDIPGSFHLLHCSHPSRHNGCCHGPAVGLAVAHIVILGISSVQTASERWFPQYRHFRQRSDNHARRRRHGPLSLHTAPPRPVHYVSTTFYRLLFERSVDARKHFLFIFGQLDHFLFLSLILADAFLIYLLKALWIVTNDPKGYIFLEGYITNQFFLSGNHLFGGFCSLEASAAA